MLLLVTITLGTQLYGSSDLVVAKPFQGTNIGDDEAKIDYYNIGYVKWAGFNGLVEYAGDDVTAVLQAGLSNQQFQREDLFDNVDNPISDKANLAGGYLKGGINYNFTEKSNVFVNAGFIDRQPYLMLYSLTLEMMLILIYKMSVSNHLRLDMDTLVAD